MNEHDSDKKEAKGAGAGAVGGALAGGAAGGAGAGMLVGGMTGPVGAAVGAAVGAVAGAVVGKKSADPDEEDKYWRENHASRPYARKDLDYAQYQPAYRSGVESYNRNPGRSFDEVEPELSRDWSSTRGTSSLEWEHARPAARDAWDRASTRSERSNSGDFGKDRG